jgi:phage replication O-like protein O
MPQPKEKAEVRHIGIVKTEKPDLSRLIQRTGFAKVPNDISDVLIPELKLDPYEQAVLFRLVRETRGWQRMTCTASYSELAKYTNVARSRVQEAIATLVDLGLVEILGKTQKGTTFRVLPGVSIPHGGIPHGGTQVSHGGTPKAVSVPQRGNIKEKKKETSKESAHVTASPEDIAEYEKATGRKWGE